jgi:sugar (pentulose or hexulose) kinase
MWSELIDRRARLDGGGARDALWDGWDAQLSGRQPVASVSAVEGCAAGVAWNQGPFEMNACEFCS